MSQFVQLAFLSDLPEQGGRLVIVDEQWIGLFQTDEGIFAIDAMCPHAGANLAKGNVCDGIVSCPVHLWQFRLADGKYLDTDNHRFDVKTYVVQVKREEVLVELPAMPNSIRLI